LTVNTFGSRHCNNVAPIGSTDTEAARQGDQIGLIFSIDNSLKITELARNLGLCFSTVNVTRHTLQKCVGLQDGQLFYKLIWGRCYDHNFLRFCQFSAKIMAFFSKTNVMINFLNNLALFWANNADFFADFFLQKYF
jgi:hypothetical protein